MKDLFQIARANEMAQLGHLEIERIRSGRVLVVGAGGLGSPAILYLAASGVGVLGIADPERVELSNLQRQIVHSTCDLGRWKVESAREKALMISPLTKVEIYPFRLREENAGGIIGNYHLVIDGTDNFATKFLLNDLCHSSGVPLVHGGVLRFLGQVMTIIPGKSACYRCVFMGPPPEGAIPTCEEAGVMGAMVGQMGIIQATEALKYLTGLGELLTDRILVCDALTMRWREVQVRRNPECPLCGGADGVYKGS